MQSLKEQIAQLDTDFVEIDAGFDLKEKEARLKELEGMSTDPAFWDDQENARDTMQELGDLKKEIDEFNELKSTIETLVELSDEGEISPDLKKDVGQIRKRLDNFQILLFLSGRYDKRNAIFSIHAGQGGTEAMDWTNILYRMYSRFFEKKEWKVSIMDMTSGEDAGIKSITLKVVGAYAYGFLKNESGTHRLVRQSPFNADNLRQTSFASVEVLPELKETDEKDIEIDPDDLEWQFYRSGGSGGQNVNKVNTAVRVKHIPSGIVVTSQAERFQEKNREHALGLLRSKLWIKKQEEEKKKVQDIKGEYTPASWGTQIRSYVLHPYKMIKDLRTEVETSDADGVLDGDLDQFIDAELRL